MRLIFLWLVLGTMPASSDLLPQAGGGAADLAMLVRQTPAGATLHLRPDQIFRLAVPLVLTRPIVIDGGGARITAVAGTGMSGALIVSRGVDGVRISNVVMDADADRDGADYGIWISGGAGHRIAGATVRNSSQACILLEDAQGIVEDNALEHCGRALTIAKGTAANNHAIMIAALTRPVADVVVRRNVVTGAWRKGVTAYTRGTGRLARLSITDNRISDCGLGGIYVGNAPGAAPQRYVTVSGNQVQRSYVGVEIDDVEGLEMARNSVVATVDRTGRPGAQGLILNNVHGATISGMAVRHSGASGVMVRNSTRVALIDATVIDPNEGRNSFGPGIHFSNSTKSQAVGGTITDERSQPRMTHGIVENDGSRSNTVSVRHISGVPAALRTLVR